MGRGCWFSLQELQFIHFWSCLMIQPEILRWQYPPCSAPVFWDRWKTLKKDTQTCNLPALVVCILSPTFFGDIPHLVPHVILLFHPPPTQHSLLQTISNPLKMMNHLKLHCLFSVGNPMVLGYSTAPKRSTPNSQGTKNIWVSENEMSSSHGYFTITLVSKIIIKWGFRGYSISQKDRKAIIVTVLDSELNCSIFFGA